MNSSPPAESAPLPAPPSPASHSGRQFNTSTPNNSAKKQQSPLSVALPTTVPSASPIYGEPTLTPPPRSPGTASTPHTPYTIHTQHTTHTPYTPATLHNSGDCRQNAPDGTSSDKSSETAVGVPRVTTTLSRKESYKAQRQNYRREKKRAASALLHSIEDPSVVVLADWLKVRGSLKSWTKLWCILKPGLLLLYKSPKAKSSHWVGTVLLTSCQVIERPSKKDGFCFKLYHPLEQSIWAPRGPHNETIGAVVQPLPTAHLIFRAPSQAAGHCWLDGLELALRCSNAMLRSPTPLMSVYDYTPKRHSSSERKLTHQVPKKSKPPRKVSKWTQFVESIDVLAKEHDNSTDSTESPKEHSFLDFLRKKDHFERNVPATSSMRIVTEPKQAENTSKSLASSPMKSSESIAKKSRLLKCFEFDMPKLPLGEKRNEKSGTPTNFIEDNLMRLFTVFPKRRSSTPMPFETFQNKRLSDLRSSGVKTDSENDDYLKCALPKKTQYTRIFNDTSLLCCTPENIMITKTAPSVERFCRNSSSSTDNVGNVASSFGVYGTPTPEKYSLIDVNRGAALLLAERRARQEWEERGRASRLAGTVISAELAGAGSDSDSDVSQPMPTPMPISDGGDNDERKKSIVAMLHRLYVEDLDRELGVEGELVEEVAEENKSLLWFLLKQVRPGMDLSKVVLPTFILEPRSFLDKLSDTYYHADMLAAAAATENPYARFLCVLRWYLSGLYKKPRGLKKPYNPVLGEVFRCCWRHNTGTTTYYIAEQVSHHPPVSAFYVSNRQEGFVIQGSLLARSKFYGNSTSAILEGCAKVFLLPHGETYVTTAPYAYCKGIIMGNLSMELGGKVHLVCVQTGYSAEVDFKLRSFLGSPEQTNCLSGRIKLGKEIVATLEGYWDGKVDIKEKKSGQETNLVDVKVLKEQRLTRYLMSLENQQEFESQRLWLKVSEAIAQDDQKAATEEKTIIEEAQRGRTRNATAPWVPRYFHQCTGGVVPPEGIVDQGWVYSHINTSPWSPSEVLEYEEDFVIKSLAHAQSTRQPQPLEQQRTLLQNSDSDSRDDLRRPAKTTNRTLKQALNTIDTSLRDHTIAIERLTKAVEAINIQQIPSRETQMHLWDIAVGFAIAILIQALCTWLFNRDGR